MTAEAALLILVIIAVVMNTTLDVRDLRKTNRDIEARKAGERLHTRMAMHKK